MTAEYNKEQREWTLKLSNLEMATLADCALFAKVDGDDEWAKQKQDAIQNVYNFIINHLKTRP